MKENTGSASWRISLLQVEEAKETAIECGHLNVSSCLYSVSVRGTAQLFAPSSCPSTGDGKVPSKNVSKTFYKYFFSRQTLARRSLEIVHNFLIFSNLRKWKKLTENLFYLRKQSVYTQCLVQGARGWISAPLCLCASSEHSVWQHFVLLHPKTPVHFSFFDVAKVRNLSIFC